MTVAPSTSGAQGEPARPSRWRASPARLGGLMLGLVLFGIGEGLIVVAGLGNSPWTVLAGGVAERTPLDVGAATVAISLIVLAVWAPLRQRPGLGTIANAVVVGLVLGAVVAVLGSIGPPVARVTALVAGIALVGLGSGYYLGAALGPGPRDGLMTALHRLTGRPVATVRVTIELTVVAAGAALGGTVGPGTLAFALLIGPAVAIALKLLSALPAAEL